MSTATYIDNNNAEAADFEEPSVAHLVEKDQNVTEAYVFGYPIVALCGKVFVPTRDPKKFPLCEPCKEAYLNEQKI